MRKHGQLSVLLLDDSPELVRLYKRQIESCGPFQVTVEIDGNRARLLAERQLFDFVVIDAKLDYQGTQFGGLRLADELRPRYGTNSILVISRFITVDLMRERGALHEFMDKSDEGQTGQFCSNLCRRIKSMRHRQYVFVAMPFGREYLPIYMRHIKVGVNRAGYECFRVDEVVHNRPIQNMIFELVDKSKLVVFLADGGNANAYYEAGFADAMRKEVVIVASNLKQLKFDVANRHTITYDSNLGLLGRDLTRKLNALRLSPPVAL